MEHYLVIKEHELALQAKSWINLKGMLLSRKKSWESYTQYDSIYIIFGKSKAVKMVNSSVLATRSLKRQQGWIGEAQGQFYGGETVLYHDTNDAVVVNAQYCAFDKPHRLF